MENAEESCATALKMEAGIEFVLNKLSLLQEDMEEHISHAQVHIPAQVMVVVWFQELDFLWKT
jgi:hypothetical protein